MYRRFRAVWSVINAHISKRGVLWEKYMVIVEYQLKNKV